jgi:Flp pilus assembly protein TadD
MRRLAINLTGTTIRSQFVAGSVLVLLTALAYSNSFSGPWVFDDLPNIRNNPAIRSWEPAQFFASGNNRPVLMSTFSINYALSGFDTVGYHATNWLIHLSAGVLLWRLLEQLLRNDRLLGADPVASRLAWLSAALWLVHPLQTESVSYIVQRAESLMGLLFIATIYLIVRGATAERGWPWYLTAIATTWLGMGCKEVMATVPMVMALIDRMLLCDSWQQVMRRRGLAYLGLVVTLATYKRSFVPLISGESVSAGFGQQGHSALEHLYSEPYAILLYLRQVIWPWPQCFDWHFQPVTTFAAAAWPGAIVVAILLTAFTAGHFQRLAALPWLVFFIVLAPTSSVIPVLDIAVEHRMYLPLAGLLTWLVVLGYRVLQRLVVPAWQSRVGLVLSLALLVSLTTSTYLRNRVYQSEVALWQSVVDLRPNNYRALNNLAGGLLAQGKAAEAERLWRRTIEMAPARDTSSITYNLARSLEVQGRIDEAIEQLDRVIALEPQEATVFMQRAELELQQGRMPKAIASLDQAANLQPSWSNVQLRLGECYLRERMISQAIEHLRRAADLQPDSTKILAALVEAYDQAGDTAQATAARQRLQSLRNSPRPGK